MKAIVIKKDSSLSWEDVPDVRPGKDEVLIKVYYVAVNRADLMQRKGTYPPPPGCPEWPGLEVSGEIVAFGQGAMRKSGLHIGDKVCALLGGGGYAEYVAVHCGLVMPVPENCTMAEAAAIPEAFATGYLNLFMEGGLKAGNVVLVQAGASGLASVLIPMAKAFGAFVITTIIDEQKRSVVAKTGADLIVNTREEDIVQVLRSFDGEGRPVNIAIDCLGGANMGDCLPYMGYMSKWIMIATLAGDLTQIDMRKLYVRNVRIVGSTLRSKPLQTKIKILNNLVKKLWGKVSSGAVRPAIYKILPITEAEAAHSLLYRGQSAGKVVLQVREGNV